MTHLRERRGRCEPCALVVHWRGGPALSDAGCMRCGRHLTRCLRDSVGERFDVNPPVATRAAPEKPRRPLPLPTRPLRAGDEIGTPVTVTINGETLHAHTRGKVWLSANVQVVLLTGRSECIRASLCRVDKAVSETRAPAWKPDAYPVE